jgi:hypothetical protein
MRKKEKLALLDELLAAVHLGNDYPLSKGRFWRDLDGLCDLAQAVAIATAMHQDRGVLREKNFTDWIMKNQYLILGGK